MLVGMSWLLMVGGWGDESLPYVFISLQVRIIKDLEFG